MVVTYKSASPSPILRAATWPEFVMSPVDLNERLARNRFTLRIRLAPSHD